MRHTYEPGVMRSLLTKRDRYFDRLYKILEASQASVIERWQLPSGDDYLYCIGPTGQVVLVVVNDESVQHYTQGGRLWADLERDLKGGA